MDQSKYWDKASIDKEFTTPFQIDLFKEHVKEDAQILDFGCGYGRTIGELSEAGFINLTGIDFSSKMIEKAEKRFQDKSFIHSTDKKLPFETDSFDAVILIAVLTCVTCDLELNDLLDEIRRVLKKGGYLYINDFLLNSDERNLKRYDDKKDNYPYGVFELSEGALLRHFSVEKIDELLSPFKPVHFEQLTYTTMNKNRSNGFCYLGKLINS